jgi:hypothetical protein
MGWPKVCRARRLLRPLPDPASAGDIGRSRAVRDELARRLHALETDLGFVE